MADAETLAQSVIFGNSGVQLHRACKEIVELRVAKTVAVGSESLGLESGAQVEKREPPAQRVVEHRE